MKAKGLGVYIHIPFCIRKCNYCDFCSFPNSSPKIMERYADELCRRIRDFSHRAHDRVVDTVYFGGGTPTLLPLPCFEKLLEALKNSFAISPDAEISCECNPASIDKNGLIALRKSGINRLSIGLQSANDFELKLLGRVHSFEDFRRTFTDARDAGFDNISADLMYGIPSQTKESFKKTLLSLVELAPEHISSYGLKIEDGTAFAKNQDSLVLPDEDTEYEMYELCVNLFGEAGYERYEISNFAKRGFESRHNLRYWKLDDYIGFGVAAHSFFDGERFGNSRDIEGFICGKDIVEESYRPSPKDTLSEYVMLGLRLGKGISRKDFYTRFGKELDSAFPSLKKYVENNFLKDDNGSVAFTTKGFFVSNSILSDLLEL